jgi:hypothetical protein
MEKPWLGSLVDALQSPPPKERVREERVSEEPVSEERVSEEPVTEEPVFERAQWASPTRPPLEYAGKTPWSESWSERVLSHAPAITVALLFVAALVVLAFFSRVQIGQSVVRLGEMISGEPTQTSAIAAPNASTPSTASTTQAASPPPLQSGSSQQPVPSANSSGANGDAAASAAAGVSKKSDASPPDASANVSSSDSASSGSRDNLGQPSAERASAQTSATSQTSTSVDNGEAEFSVAQASLSQARTPEAKARAAELLWAAVAKGSSGAEIELADAYGRGAGVRKNCEQARILLAAARDKNNPLAEKEAAELRVYGCR